jgi:cupin 2 domain-containing protein
MVVRGEETLEFEGGELVRMQEGDYLTIPRHVKHRVQRTGPKTIWLAVHVRCEK